MGKRLKERTQDRFVGRLGTNVLNHDLTGGGGGMLQFHRISSLPVSLRLCWHRKHHSAEIGQEEGKQPTEQESNEKMRRPRVSRES